MSAFAEIIAWVCVALAQLGLIGGAVACYMYRGVLSETFKTETKGMKVTGDDTSDLYEFNSLNKAY